jgi:serine/threonine protein kinase
LIIMPLAQGDKIGPYEIVDLLGKGGMGVVYRAHDTNLSRDVAIKVLPAALAQDPDRLARFEREAKVLAALNHPNIAIIYGLEKTATNARAIVMELVEGPTLADRLEKGAVPLKETLSIARQIADALEAAHEKGVVHRDLKRANVKVREDGTVKVLDFGLATAVLAGVREAGHGADSPTLTLGATQAGMILGTVAYMAPEQAEGKPVDRRADIWSFGVVLWEMLTGKRLFHADTVPLTLADVLRKELDFTQVPEGTPAPVRELLKRCLDRDVKTRLRNMGEARVAIVRYVADPTSGAAVAPPTVTAPSRVSRMWPSAAAALAVTLGAVSFVHFREQPPRAPEPARFQIPFPDKSSPAPFPNPTISPDGRQIVFQAVTDGVPRLWVRGLDQVEPRPLAGTEGVAGLQFWSPDSRFVAVDVQGTLKKVETSGGPPQTLCRLPGILLGGLWTADGRIVFGTLTTGLFQVAAAGGAASPLTVLDPKRQEVYHAFPALLPDGRHFLYRRNTAIAETGGIYLGTLPTGTVNPDLQGQAPKRLLTDDSDFVFAPPLDPRASGYVLFSREGTLMAQPFDSVRLEFSQAAVPIAEQVARNGDFSVSSTGVLVYATSVGIGGGASRLTWYDRQGKSLGAAGAPGFITNLELAPDGARVATDRTTGDGRKAIWVDEFARGVSNRITPPDTSVRPVWSPDGNRLVFASQPNISLKAASNAGKEEVLFKFEHPTDPLDWSRDGGWLLYKETDPKTSTTCGPCPWSWENPLESRLKNRQCFCRQRLTRPMADSLPTDVLWPTVPMSPAGSKCMLPLSRNPACGFPSPMEAAINRAGGGTVKSCCMSHPAWM